ncbi:alpha/beta hydrolase [Pseudarthrobacter sp. AL07]|uniref:alpha/beta fold hydrolase n=2 Tax=unclassified Pseudarthrobacter TaxID=2647000 RepID=UPI00249C2F49|nr:alpha/beta hydrolase [Pseudarthrobacter sp. AL07]MDI3209750.1 alpha/beta hydrolase [Pseudarthrobacter sp. AL07]
MGPRPATQRIRTWIRVPGMLCTAEIFTAMDPYLCLGGATVDTRIEGTTLDEAAEHLLELARRQEGPVGIIGLSLGAIVAMAAAVKDPSIFHAAVLISTNPRGPRLEQMQAWEELVRRNTAGAFPEIAGDLAPALFAPARITAALLRTGTAMAEHHGPRVFADQLGIQRSRRDLRTELQRVTARTLVLAGSEDQLCTPEMHHDIATAMPHAELHIMPGAGHLMPLEGPEATANTINHWNRRKTS